jgi:hypothetical protein
MQKKKGNSLSSLQLSLYASVAIPAGLLKKDIEERCPEALLKGGLDIKQERRKGSEETGECENLALRIRVQKGGER